jgi:hypothetical protein
MKSRRASDQSLARALQGTLAAAPPTSEAIPTHLAVLKVFFGYFRFRGG